MGMGSSSRYSRVRCMAAQSMVVSVGPYMLTTCSPGTAAFHKFTYRACSASPPSAAFFRCVGAYFVSAPEAATRWNAEVAQLIAVTPASSMALQNSVIQAVKSRIARCGMTMPFGVPVEPEVKST